MFLRVVCESGGLDKDVNDEGIKTIALTGDKRRLLYLQPLESVYQMHFRRPVQRHPPSIRRPDRSGTFHPNPQLVSLLLPT